MRQRLFAVLLAVLLLAPLAVLAHDEAGGTNETSVGDDGCEYRTMLPYYDENGGGDQTPVDILASIKLTCAAGQTATFEVGIVNYDTLQIVAGATRFYTVSGPFFENFYQSHEWSCVKDGPNGPTNLPHKRYASYVTIDGVFVGGFAAGFDTMAGKWRRAHVDCGE